MVFIKVLPRPRHVQSPRDEDEAEDGGAPEKGNIEDSENPNGTCNLPLPGSSR